VWQSGQSPARVGVRLQCLVHLRELTFISWDPRHTPFSQLVDEMVDMDVQVLKRGNDVADIPADIASIAGISQAASGPKP
jgi:hypothetical protein